MAQNRPHPAYGEAAIRKALNTRLIGRDLIFLPQTTSTNVAAKKLGRKGCPEGLVVVADHQTAGRGRSGRRWSAPPGSDILMSIVLRPSIAPERCSVLTEFASLAVAKAIEARCGLQPQIKWPNDVLIQDKKVCGILTEGHVRGDALAFVVIGVGVNCNRDEKSFHKSLRGAATSLLMETGEPVDRARLLADVLANLETEYMQFAASGLSHIAPELRQRLWRLNESIVIRTGEDEVRGVCVGLDDEGRLLVRDNRGRRRAFWGGEILHLR